MKKLIFLFLVSFVGVGSLVAQNPAPANPNGAVASWDKIVMDFGSIPFNIPKTAEFTLTNSGKAPLTITSARASCGCTNLKYSPEPVLPGKTTIVSATYNAAVQGVFTKTITVITNADPNPVVLQIKGVVLPPPGTTTAPVNSAIPK